MPQSASIELRGVRVHNLKNIDVDIPLGRITVITGVSGSGKSSLAFDTLYAEGQRRYIESFSTYARRFLDRLDKPDSDRIDHLPPAIALRQNERHRRRDRIASVTEIDNYLRLLFSRLGQVVCPSCGRQVARSIPADVVTFITSVSVAVHETVTGGRGLIGFSIASTTTPAMVASWLKIGLSRALVVTEQAALFVPLGEVLAADILQGRALVVVDRLSLDKLNPERMTESIETAFREGQGRCVVFLESTHSGTAIDGRKYRRSEFSTGLSCVPCGREFVEPEPSLFNARSPLGACPNCHGTGRLKNADEQRPRQSAGNNSYRVRKGLTGDLGSRDCEACGNTGLCEAARSVRIRSGHQCHPPHTTLPGVLGQAEPGNDPSIADLLTAPISATTQWLRDWSAQLSADQHAVSQHLVPELLARLSQLLDCGLGYLSLHRTLDSLSQGETQRVSLSSVLASRLVNTLFVLDEPSAGLHPNDFQAVLRGIERLRDTGNTVVVVEHESDFIAISDQHVQIGPGAGTQGGSIVAVQSPRSSGKSVNVTTTTTTEVRRPKRSVTSWIELQGILHRHLRDLTVKIPVGALCVVTGVSGSGKSTLLEEVLWPGLSEELHLACPHSAVGRVSKIIGARAIDAVLFVDDAPLVGGRRSNPATWLKAFDEIRKLFAESTEARQRGLTAAHFSFNNEHGGRCPKCQGIGHVAIDMQFLADVVMPCPECHGQRFTRETLDITWRNVSIADVLKMTANDAFVFFKGQRRLQRKLKSLKDVGLGYLTLGQPLQTLSGGEAQRLKLAGAFARSQQRTLILMNEPTAGLHPQDVAQLLKCFQELLDVGQSLIVTENDPQVLAAADYVIELGPGAGPNGGRILRAE